LGLFFFSLNLGSNTNKGVGSRTAGGSLGGREGAPKGLRGGLGCG